MPVKGVLLCIQCNNFVFLHYIQCKKYKIMDKRLLKTIIVERQREIAETNLFERAISFESNANYVIVGIRRAGKSYQMFQDIKSRVGTGEISIDDCLYINFEDERIASMRASELHLLLECYAELFGGKRPLVYLDEIQNIEGWEKFVRRLADSKYRVMVTGSNAKMLSREIATTLGGRFIIREVFPFSFREYLGWKGISAGSNWEYDKAECLDVFKACETYLHFGGFAETFGIVNKREWINSLYQKIILGDIIARNNIRNGNAIRLMTKKLAESVMQPMSQTRLLNVIKSSGNVVGRNTVAEYLSYMEEAYLLFRLANFTDSFTERSVNRKRYFFDNGLLNNFLTGDEPKLLENVVAVDLIKRYRQSEGDSVFFYNKGVEVDFFVPDEKLAVQVAYSINDPVEKEREVRALKKLSDTFEVRKNVIVTMDEEANIVQDSIEINVIPVWKWLLRND